MLSSVLVSDANGKVSASSVSAATLGYLDATSSVQSQLNGKQATVTGAATSIVSANLSASSVLVSDANGKVSASSVSSTTLGYLDATSSVQTQINSKANQTDLNTTNTNLSNHLSDNNAHSSLFALKANLNGDAGQVFNVANAIQPNNAIPMGQINSFLNFVPYSVNSGAVDVNGFASFISKVDNATVKIAATTTPIVLTYPDGSQETINADINAGSLTNGNPIFVKEKGNSVIIPVNTGYLNQNSAIPAMLSNSCNGYTLTFDYSNLGTQTLSSEYAAFDGNMSTGLSVNFGQPGCTGTVYGSPEFIIQCPSPKIFKNFSLYSATGDGAGQICGAYVYGSNDGSTWTYLAYPGGNVHNSFINQCSFANSYSLNNNTAYLYYKVTITNVNLTGGLCGAAISIREMQFYEYLTGGAITESAVAPTSPSNGDYWLNISVKPYQPYKYNGSSWVLTQYVKLGEVVITSGTMGTPISYAFNGRYIGIDTACTTTATVTVFNHNIGTRLIKPPILQLRCVTTEYGYSAGDIVFPSSSGGSYTYPDGVIITGINTVQNTTGSSAAYAAGNKTTGAGVTLTVANWKQSLMAERIF